MTKSVLARYSQESVDSIGKSIRNNPFLSDDATRPQTALVDVIVPIYNAPDQIVECVHSVALHTGYPFRLILLNDASTDSQVSQILAGIGPALGVVIIERPANLGFASAVNEGLALSSTNDVVILNSDTVVSHGWLEKMTAVARSRPNVATVTPLTNNGTLCSVPNPFEDNEIPAGYDVDSFAALVYSESLGIYPEAPTGVGFCMLVTRRVLDAIGGLDAETFGRGYGEENDFCQRAIRAGFVNLIADDTFVYHKGAASFGPLGGQLLAQNLSRLAQRYPAYLDDVARFQREHPLKVFHAQLKSRTAAGRRPAPSVALRILHVLHQGGGTERHARDMASMTDPRVLNYVLTSDARALAVDEYYAGARVDSMRFPLMAPILGDSTHLNAEYKTVLSTICSALDVDLIHVHHLMSHTLDIADVAAERGIPYVMSLHDYYTLCPTYTLLDTKGYPCADCREGKSGGVAAACMNRFRKPASYLLDYQRRMHGFLQGASRLIAPSQAAKEVLCGRFPDLTDRIEVIEHGYPNSGVVAEPAGVANASDQGRPKGLNVAVIGGLDPHKGLSAFRDLLRANRNRGITFHVYGTSTDSEIARDVDVTRTLGGSRLVYHGPYDSAEIVGKLAADRIDVGLQPAIWPETFSYTLSEFVAAGVPVIVRDLGAQGERTRRFSLGWIVSDIRDHKAIMGVLNDLVARPEAAREMAMRMNRTGALRGMSEMWSDYLAIYGALAGNDITHETRLKKPGPDRTYLAYLGRQLAVSAAAVAERQEPAARAEAEIQWLRERMRSPRHRIAEAMANAIQKIPVVWPIVAAVTDFVLRVEGRRRTR